MRKVLLIGSQNQRLQIGLAQFKAVHVGTDDAELFSLFGTHLSVYGSLDFLHWGFDILGKVLRHVKRLVAFQQTGRDCGSGFAKDIRKHIVQLDVRNGKAILSTVLLTGSEVRELSVIAH